MKLKETRKPNPRCPACGYYLIKNDWPNEFYCGVCEARYEVTEDGKS